MSSRLQQFFFIFRYRYLYGFTRKLRKLLFVFLGMEVGKGTFLPSMFVTWPHQIRLGKDCRLETGIHFKFDGIWKEGPCIQIGNRNFIGNGCEFNIQTGIVIGDDCLIASGCRFIDHDHSIIPGKLIREQSCSSKSIIIENNVWLGANAIILKGVSIGQGSVIAAGAVVNKPIPSNEIWAGVPAKKIGTR